MNVQIVNSWLGAQTALRNNGRAGYGLTSLTG